MISISIVEIKKKYNLERNLKDSSDNENSLKIKEVRIEKLSSNVSVICGIFSEAKVVINEQSVENLKIFFAEDKKIKESTISKILNMKIINNLTNLIGEWIVKLYTLTKESGKHWIHKNISNRDDHYKYYYTLKMIYEVDQINIYFKFYLFDIKTESVNKLDKISDKLNQDQFQQKRKSSKSNFKHEVAIYSLRKSIIKWLFFRLALIKFSKYFFFF